ncbi:molybdopterin converting factor subunit 1 [Alcanivorax sp. IO_7]|nr:molybdopterin converting factor subunit 1 [Alcanivorax sp. IO_7]
MSEAVIEVRFFAALRERVGEEVLRVSPPPAVTTVAALCDWLAAGYPAVATALEATPRRMVAINEELATPDSAVAAGDTVALFPPVTGG